MMTINNYLVSSEEELDENHRLTKFAQFDNNNLIAFPSAPLLEQESILESSSAHKSSTTPPLNAVYAISAGVESAPTATPSTDTPSTVAPTTAIPTSTAPSTDTPTTEPSITVTPTTTAPSTDMPTTVAPTTLTPTTVAPTTATSFTDTPTSGATGTLVSATQSTISFDNILGWLSGILSGIPNKIGSFFSTEKSGQRNSLRHSK